MTRREVLQELRGQADEPQLAKTWGEELSSGYWLLASVYF